MTTIREVRDRALDALRDDEVGGLLFAYPPTRFTGAPMTYVQPGQPYVNTEDVTYGTHRVYFEIRHVARPGTNDVTTSALDDFIEQAVIALHNADFTISEVSEPFSLLTEGEGVFPAVSIFVNTTIRFGD